MLPFDNQIGSAHYLLITNFEEQDNGYNDGGHDDDCCDDGCDCQLNNQVSTIFGVWKSTLCSIIHVSKSTVVEFLTNNREKTLTPQKLRIPSSSHPIAGGRCTDEV